MASQFTKLLHAYNVGAVVSLIAAGLSRYYLSFSRFTPWDDEQVPDAPDYTDREMANIKKELLMGKRLQITDTAFMIKKRVWQPDKPFVMYDDTVDLRDKDFYVLNSANNVYKCLYNNGGANSTVEPTAVSTEPFTTVGDGYVWKYMYTLSDSASRKWSTDAYIPIVANSSVIANAVDGAIHVIVIETGGSGYNIETGTIQQVLSPSVFRIANTASSSNGYYNGSTITLTGGTGLGTQAVVNSYHVNASGKFITTKSSLAADTTSTYSIGPTIEVDGNGSGLVAYVSETNNTTGVINRIDILNPGQGYDYVENISVSSFSGSGAKLRAIISPQGGHGANTASELLCEHFGASVELEGNESGTVPTDITFRTVSFILNPTVYGSTTLPYTANTFDATTRLEITGATGSFNMGERIRGLTSGARGLVAFANTSFVRMTAIQGNFQTSEIVQGANGLLTATITDINTPDIHPSTYDVLYVSNIVETERSDSKTETAKMYARF